jgi:hypothetical protein
LAPVVAFGLVVAFEVVVRLDLLLLIRVVDSTAASVLTLSSTVWVDASLVEWSDFVSVDVMVDKSVSVLVARDTEVVDSASRVVDMPGTSEVVPRSKAEEVDVPVTLSDKPAATTATTSSSAVEVAASALEGLAVDSPGAVDEAAAIALLSTRVVSLLKVNFNGSLSFSVPLPMTVLFWLLVPSEMTIGSPTSNWDSSARVIEVSPSLASALSGCDTSIGVSSSHVQFVRCSRASPSWMPGSQEVRQPAQCSFFW